MNIPATMPSQKPFEALDELRIIINDGAPPVSPTKTTKTRSSTKSIVDEIIDKCLDTWTRYEAIGGPVRR